MIVKLCRKLLTVVLIIYTTAGMQQVWADSKDDIQAGFAAKTRGEYQEAIRLFSRAIQSNPDLAQAYNGRGSTYRAMKSYNKAIADLDRAVELQPEGSVHYYHRGNIFFDQDKYKLAIADYTQAIKLQPNYAMFHDARCLAYLHSGQNKLAIKDCTRALQLEPGNTSVRKRLERMGVTPTLSKTDTDQQLSISPLRIWIIGSPHDRSVPRRRLPSRLAKILKRHHARAIIKSFSAKQFPARYADARSEGKGPDILIGQNILPFRKVMKEPGLKTRLQRARGILKYTYVFLDRDSKHYTSARKLALRKPQCPSSWKASDPALSEDLEPLTMILIPAYLKGDKSALRTHMDAQYLSISPIRLKKNLTDESVEACRFWGNNKLAFVPVVTSFESEQELGHKTILLIFRNKSERWRLLSATADPVTISQINKQLATLLNKLHKQPRHVSKLRPARLKSPANYGYPAPQGKKRFGNYTWQPSTDRKVIAEVVEFSRIPHGEGPRLFIMLRNKRNTPSSISAGKLWGKKWRWRVLSIGVDGSVVFSKSRVSIRSKR